MWICLGVLTVLYKLQLNRKWILQISQENVLKFMNHVLNFFYRFLKNDVTVDSH